MTLTRNHKALLAVVAMAAAVAAYWMLALAPKREQATKLKTEIAAKQTELEQARTQVALYEESRSSYRANYATLARLGKAVPADDDVRSMLVQLDAAAKRTGVSFRKIEVGTGAGAPASATDASAATTGELAAAPGTIEVGDGFSALPFSFAFDGTFFDLSEFFSRLERFVTVSNDDIGVNGRLLRLESVQIQPSQSGFPLMEAQVNAASYLVAPPEPVGSAPGVTGDPAEGAAVGGGGEGDTASTTTATATGVTP